MADGEDNGRSSCYFKSGISQETVLIINLGRDLNKRA